MPEMTSLTRVCEPKPMATPTTPAPAISGPTSMPSAESAISTAITASTTNSTLRRDRQQGAHPRPCGEWPPAWRSRRDALGVSQLAVDPGPQHVPEQLDHQQDHHRMQGAAQQPRDSVVSLAIELTSTSQIQASSRAAPMIQSARRPRSSRHGGSGGTASAVSEPGGRRTWATDGMRDAQQGRQPPGRPARC